jgi:predicted ATPase
MLVGRDREQRRIEALLEGARRRETGRLVVRGEAGIGKTSLLAYAAEAAAGMRVLRAHGVEAEAELAFSSLLELVRPLLGLIERLSEHQAAALRGSLGLAPPLETSRLVIGAATLALLAAAAEEELVLCLVDDAHWVDDASQDALRFAARRLDGEPIAFVFAVREGEARGFALDATPQLRLGGLDASASAALLARRERNLAPAVVSELVRVTSGNPLALLELPDALTDTERAGTAPLRDPLPVTEAVQRAFARRIARLDAPGRTALLVAAA